MLNYSRMDETEADQIGLQYLTSAGYRPQGLQGAFEKIRRKQWASGIDIPEYLSTHPTWAAASTRSTPAFRGFPPPYATVRTTTRASTASRR